jgi:polyhydroxybutyrate depolymerase
VGPRAQELFSFMTPSAQARGMAVVYPQGLRHSWNAGGFCCGPAHEDGVDDVRFVRDLVARLEQQLCIDRRRIYATGMSNGAIFAYRLACDMSETFAAIAPVAGAEMATVACTPKHPVSVLAFNGALDHVIWYGGGGPDLYPGIENDMARWAARDGCARPLTKTVYQNGEVDCRASEGCAQGTDVSLCRVRFGGHAWPGGGIVPVLGHTTSDLDATESMLDFFLAHPKR